MRSTKRSTARDDSYRHASTGSAGDRRPRRGERLDHRLEVGPLGAEQGPRINIGDVAQDQLEQELITDLTQVGDRLAKPSPQGSSPTPRRGEDRAIAPGLATLLADGGDQLALLQLVEGAVGQWSTERPHPPHIAGGRQVGGHVVTMSGTSREHTETSPLAEQQNVLPSCLWSRHRLGTLVSG